MRAESLRCREEEDVAESHNSCVFDSEIASPSLDGALRYSPELIVGNDFSVGVVTEFNEIELQLKDIRPCVDAAFERSESWDRTTEENGGSLVEPLHDVTPFEQRTFRSELRDRPCPRLAHNSEYVEAKRSFQGFALDEILAFELCKRGWKRLDHIRRAL